MSRRRLVAGLLASLVVLAGCTGGDLPSPNQADSVDAGESSIESRAESGSSDANADDGADDAVSQWERFAFEEGEFYRYRVTDHANDRSVTVTWEVLSVEGGEVTATVTRDDGNHTFARTVTGENATILWDLRDVDHEREDAEAAIETAGYLTLGPFNAMTSYYEHRELDVGDSWRLSGSEEAGYVTANVEGRNRYAGIDCYETAIRVPDGGWSEDAYEFESCIAPDASLALSTAYYDAGTGELTAEIVLEEYRSG